MWRRFVLRFLGVFLGGSALLFGLLALADPWGTLPFPSPLPRGPADHSQRWAYPELARSTRFDAAVIGNSTSRLINPADLDGATGAHFVNLAMVHAFAWEQMQLLDVFVRAHPAPKAVLVGLDRLWCERGEQPGRVGYGPLPDWLYRDDPIAAVANLFNMHAIETAWRSASARLGWSSPNYGANGWQLIDVDHHQFDPALAKRLIGENLAEPWSRPDDPNPATWRFQGLDWLRERVDRLPAATRLLLVFVARHHLYPAPDTPGAAMIAECKSRMVALARTRPNTGVYDLSMPSRMTMDESLWWDAVHMRPEPMATLSRELGDAIAGRPSDDAHILVATPPPATLSAR